MDKIILNEDEAAVFNQLNDAAKNAAESVQVQQQLLKQSQQHAHVHHASHSAFVELMRKNAGVEKFEGYSITEEDGNLVIVPTREPQPVNPSAS
jgi:uncharacterized protein (DUF2336 family)